MDDDRVGLFAKIMTVLVILFLVAPLVVIILASFSGTAIVVFPPRGFSLKWYANIFIGDTDFMGGLRNSLFVALTATLADAVRGVAAALGISRHGGRSKNALTAFFTSPMYVPSITFAFVMLQIFSSIGRVPAFWQILAGHVVIILPYIMRNTLAILATFDWTLEDAAASLGATPGQSFFKVTLPLIKPGVIAGALLSFLYSFDEVVLAGLLSSPKFMTLPLRIMNYMEYSFDPTLAAISTVLILFSLGAVTLLERFVGLDMFVKQEAH
jgi:putative spermidine/putrescine transport system permease protein